MSSRGGRPHVVLADQLVPNSQRFGNTLNRPSINQEPLLTSPELSSRTALPVVLAERARNNMYSDLVLEFNMTQKDHKETRDALIGTCHTFGQSVS
jgi:hypothetical protein